MELLKVKNLYKKYYNNKNEKMVLKDINLDIESGEFVSIVGESGSGKSTLLSVMGTMASPSSGSVYYNGKEISGLDSNKRSEFRQDNLGFVFQSFFLVPYLTLLENVMIPMTFLNISRDEKKHSASEALEKVGLLDKISKLPSEVSGGEMERASIARAVVNKPNILLADEPTGNLDSGNSMKVMELFRNFSENGMTIIMVTHSEACASRSDRIVRMNDGEIV